MQFARPWPRACQIMNNVLLTFILWISSNNCLENLQWKPIKIACSSIFEKKSNGKTSEQHFVFELPFIVWEVRTRGGLSGPPGHVHSPWFSCWRVPFFKLFLELFSGKWCHMDPKWHHASWKNYSKTTLEIKSAKMCNMCWNWCRWTWEKQVFELKSYKKY